MFQDGGLGCWECSDAAGVELEYHSSGRVDPCAVSGESPAVEFEYDVMAEQTGVCVLYVGSYTLKNNTVVSLQG